MNAPLSHWVTWLLDDPDFVEWALGRSPQTDAHWMQWAASSMVQTEALETARTLVHALKEDALEISDAYIEARVGEALRIARDREQMRKNRRISGLAGIRTLGIAATLIGLLGIAWLVYSARFNADTAPGIAIEAESDSGTFETIAHTGTGVRYVALPDGSSVVLRQNSSVRFPKQFDSLRREIALTGEAFFEVTKNPEQPFFVYANEVVAKVHGTSFSIKADGADANVVVAVKTGKVSVFTKSDANAGKYKKEKGLMALVLGCNEQATFERSLSRFVLSKIKRPALLNIPIEQQAFTYSETPAGEVFAALGRAYGVDISYDAETMAHCSITATLGDEPLENKLKWICAILEAEYEITPGKILIRGNPCK